MSSRKGASLVEYGILAGLISVATIGSVVALGAETGRVLTVISQSLGSASIASNLASGSPDDEDPTDPECYNSANVGSVGDAGWNGCAGMLIVDTATFRASGSSIYGGDESLEITTGDGTFTFIDDGMNIFTG